MATSIFHYLEAERLIRTADEWLDADYGWKATMSTDERLARRAGDIAAAQAHATLALAAVTALGQREINDHGDRYSTGVLASDGYDAWWRAASERSFKEQQDEYGTENPE